MSAIKVPIVQGDARLKIPTSTQYITFPTEPKQSVVIAWSEGRVPQIATYYVTKCYWGNYSPTPAAEAAVSRLHRPDVVEDPNSTLNILGETKLYIAAELIEPHYAGGALAGYHIQDLATDAAGEVSGWITMRLNGCFHYGQDKIRENKFQRWIVYHPPVSRDIPAPKIYQQRFTNLASIDFAKLGLGTLGEQGPAEYTAALTGWPEFAEFGSLGLEVIKGLVGDPLHRFLDPLGVQAAAKLQLKVPYFQSAGVNLTDEAKEEQRITALQLIEASGAQFDNNNENLAKKDRARDAAGYLEELRVLRSQKLSWWKGIFSPIMNDRAPKAGVWTKLNATDPPPADFNSDDHEDTKSILTNLTKADDPTVQKIITDVREAGIAKIEAAEKQGTGIIVPKRPLPQIAIPPHKGPLSGLGGRGAKLKGQASKSKPNLPPSLARQTLNGGWELS